MEEEEGGGAIYCRDLVGGMCRYLRFASVPFSFLFCFLVFLLVFCCLVGLLGGSFIYGVIRGDDIWVGGVMTCVEFLSHSYSETFRAAAWSCFVSFRIIFFNFHGDRRGV